jgi:spore germination protein YaaH
MKPALCFVSLCALFSATLLFAAEPKSMFYMTDSPNSIKSFIDHADRIDILVPTWYSADGSGLVWGGPNPDVLKTAAARHVAVMPIVASTAQGELHKLFSTPASRQAFTDSLLGECRKYAYSGFQIDFENIYWNDRDLLSGFVAEVAAALHKEKFQLTIATVPNAPGSAGKSGFSRWIYANWRGAYDLKALSQSVDQICVMTYDQNTRWTQPGPVAGYPWTVENLDYALQFAPKEKLFLGIPVYAYHWYAGDPGDAGKDDKPNPTADYIGQQEIDQYIAAYHPRVEWDPVDRTSWFYFYRDDMRDWVFYTDKRGFQERFNLARDRGMQGFCSWVLGSEDPEIWTVLPSHK